MASNANDPLPTALLPPAGFDFPEDVEIWTHLRKLSLAPGGFGAKRVAIWLWLLRTARSPQFVLNNESEPVKDSNHSHTNRPPTQVLDKAQASRHRDEHQILLDTQRSFILYPVEDDDERVVLQTQLHELIVSIFLKRPKLSYFQGFHDIVTVLFLTLPSEAQFACTEQLSLHRLRDSMGSGLEPVLALLRTMRCLLRLADPAYASQLERNIPLPYFALSNLLTLFSHDMPTLPLVQHVFDYLLCRPPIFSVYLATAIVLNRKDEVRRLEEEGEEGMVHSLLCSLPILYDDDESLQPAPPAGETPEEPAPSDEDRASVTASIPNLEGCAEPSEGDTASSTDFTLFDPCDSLDTAEDPSQMEKYDTTPLESKPMLADNECSQLPTAVSDLRLDTKEEHVELEDASMTKVVRTRLSPIRVSLSSLLIRADELYATYPPTHPLIDLSSIMGPNSVVFTWSEDPSMLPDDDEAEEMVTKPELVALPYVPEASDVDSSEKHVVKKGRGGVRSRFPFPLILAFSTLWDRRHIILGRRGSVFVGAVVVLSVAILAAYDLRRSSNGQQAAVARLGRWLGRLLDIVRDRVVEGVVFW